MKATTLFTFLFLAATASFAQGAKVPAALKKVWDTKTPAASIPAGIAGSPLLFESFMTAKIWLASQPDAPFDAEVNYNLEKQWLVVSFGKEGQGNVAVKYLKRFEIQVGPQTWTYEVRTDVSKAGSKEMVCYKALYHQKFTFYKQQSIKAETVNGKPTYKNNSSYWLSTPGGQFQKIDLNQASLEKALPKYAKQIKTYMSQQSNSIINETVIANLLAYLEAQ